MASRLAYGCHICAVVRHGKGHTLTHVRLQHMVAGPSHTVSCSDMHFTTAVVSTPVSELGTAP